MPIIQRPVKQYGQRTYVADEAAAPLNPSPPPTNLKTIRAVEFDGDLDTAYTLLGGGLDNDNIAVGANIDGLKLADDSVTPAKLTVGGPAVTAAPTLQHLAADGTATFATLTITTGGGPVLVSCPVLASLTLAPAAAGGAAFVLDRDSGAVIQSSTAAVANNTADTLQVPAGAYPTWIDVVAAGTHTYLLQIKLESSAGVDMVVAADPVVAFAKELV